MVMGMRRTILVLTSMALALLLASGMALAVTRSSETPPGHRFEPKWMDEPVAPQEEGQLETLVFANHWDSVTSNETLSYANPKRIYPSAVAHAARAWNALNQRFDGRGVRLVEVRPKKKSNVRIVGFRDCRGRNVLGYAQYRARFPDRLGVNTCVLDRSGSQLREHVLTHELGHHLGSGHQPPRFCGKSIMLARVPCGQERRVLTKPGPRDVRWYRDRWVS
jgi:hypothetical protein